MGKVEENKVRVDELKRIIKSSYWKYDMDLNYYIKERIKELLK